MFWTIVGALIFVFFIAPIILNVLMSILGAMFESDNKGCAITVIVAIVIIVLLILIF